MNERSRPIWRETAEVIGVLGVIGSLIFVGLEVRQSSVATRASTNAAVADSYRELAVLMASSPQLARAAAAAANGLDTLSPEDQIVLLGFYRALFHSWSNLHRQEANGTLDQAIYESLIRELTVYSAHAGSEARSAELLRRGQGVRWAWEHERYLFSEEFQEFMDSSLGLAE